MNLFYKYSHLQRFEQQNEKDGRNVKDNKMRNNKIEQTNEKWEMRNEKGKRGMEKEIGITKEKEKEKTSRLE